MRGRHETTFFMIDNYSTTLQLISVTREISRLYKEHKHQISHRNKTSTMLPPSFGPMKHNSFNWKQQKQKLSILKVSSDRFKLLLNSAVQHVISYFRRKIINMHCANGTSTKKPQCYNRHASQNKNCNEFFLTFQCLIAYGALSEITSY